MTLRPPLVALILILGACASSAESLAESEPPPTSVALEDSAEAPVESEEVAGDATERDEITDLGEVEATGSATTDSAEVPPTTVPGEIPEGIPELLRSAYDADAPRAFNDRIIPVAPTSQDEAVALFVEVENALRVDGLSDQAYADLGHTEQLIVRTLIRNTEWIPGFLEALPDELRPFGELHIEARQQLGLHVGDAPLGENVPPWRIVDPAPAEDLLSFYRSAEQETGIEWEVLAGVNLVETVIGRIDGVSSAGAQGPMQFLPTTWPEVSQGGNVLDPSDAIHGAGRYLVQRGGLENINDGLWGYNNSFTYGNAVLAYAEMLRLDERAFRGIYNWEVYVGSVEGTLWLPVGYDQAERIPAGEYLAQNPWATTLG